MLPEITIKIQFGQDRLDDSKPVGEMAVSSVDIAPPELPVGSTHPEIPPPPSVDEIVDMVGGVEAPPPPPSESGADDTIPPPPTLGE